VCSTIAALCTRATAATATTLASTRTDAHIAAAAAAEEVPGLEEPCSPDADGFAVDVDTPETVLTPDGKPIQGSLLRYADEVGGVLEVVAYSENLHYSLRNLDYRMRVQPDGPPPGHCCIVS
jgi:hypothetical protein